MTTYTIVVPGCGWLTANPRSTTDRYGRAATIRAWREATVVACLQAKLPKDITPVTIHAVAFYSSRQAPVRDRLNLAPTIKAIVDGLGPPKAWTRNGAQKRSAGYGLLPDDSDDHVLSTDWKVIPGQRDEVHVAIQEVTSG